MRRHFATICSRITRFSPKCFEKDHCLQVNAKFVSVGEIFFDKQPELDTYYERRHPACERDISDSVEDPLLIKTTN